MSIDELVKIGWSREGAKFLIARNRSKSLARFFSRIGGAKKHQKEYIPDNIRWVVWERDDFRCKKCGTRRNLSIDHIHPESLGGKLELDNLQTLCRKCNSKKGMR